MKEDFLARQRSQKDLTLTPKDSSDKMDTFSFHRPGPRGIGSGIGTDNTTAEWSEKGQGIKSQKRTRCTQG